MITLHVEGLNRLRKFAEQYPATAEKYINTAITKSLTRIFGAVQINAPFGVSGLLRGNWRIAPGRFSGTLTSLAQYAADVEYGTPPHMVNVNEITPWAKKKGIPVWAVVNSIKKKGTKANPFLQRSVDSVEEGVNQDFVDGLTQAVAALAALDDTP